MLKKSKIIYILRGIIVILWHIWLKFHRSAQKGEEVKTRALNNSVVCGVFKTLSMVILSTYKDALFCVMLLFLGYQIHFQKLLWIFFLEIFFFFIFSTCALYISGVWWNFEEVKPVLKSAEQGDDNICKYIKYLW